MNIAKLEKERYVYSIDDGFMLGGWPGVIFKHERRGSGLLSYALAWCNIMLKT